MLTIALNKLELSPENVRKSNGDTDIESLAADIAGRGLKQNLVVTERANGGYYVDAGGRRLRALKMLAKAGTIAANHPVPCLVEKAEQALETSLAENIHRIAMNPADEAEAFAAILEREARCGVTERKEQIAGIAKRFGVTTRHVEQRLTLVALAPDIFEALRQGNLTLDAAKAYARHPDHDVQMRIFAAEANKAMWQHSPQSIRNQIDGVTLTVQDRKFQFVTEEAYLAAGGRFQTDLFMGEPETVVLDPHLVETLFNQCMAEATRIEAAQSGFAGGMMMPDPFDPHGIKHPKVPAGYERRWLLHGIKEPRDPSTIIALYVLDVENRLILADYYFRKIEEKGDAASSDPASNGTAEKTANTAPNTAPLVGPTSDERAQLVHAQYQAANRMVRIENRAAHLALPPLADLPWAHKIIVPEDEKPPVEVDDNGDFLVCIQIRIPRDEAEPFMVQAELQISIEEDFAKAVGAEDPEEEPIDPGVNDVTAPEPTASEPTGQTTPVEANA